MKRKAFVSLAIAFTLFAAITMASLEKTALGENSQRGPMIDTWRNKVTRSPSAQLIEMTIGPPGGSDVWTGLTRSADVVAMDYACRTISWRGGLHYNRIAFNMREHPLSDVNFRHALAHLVPKDRIIGNLFKITAVKLDTPVPPSQAIWYNPNVDPHPYSPAEAEAILAAASYQKISGAWKDENGNDLPMLRFYVPLAVVDPTSFMIGNMVATEAQAIGLNNIVLTPMDYATYIDRTFNQWDFDLALVSQRLSRFPTHLWNQFSSENNFLGSDNPHGIIYPELDADLSFLWRSLDHDAKVAAALSAQELIMGGTATNPLPLNVPDTDPRSQALPTIPIYSKNIHDVHDSRLEGALNMFGYGIDNSWSRMEMHWNLPNEYRPGTTEKLITFIEREYPERLNPLWAFTDSAQDFMEYSFDDLIAINPYTLKDEPWLATDWSYVAVPDGMDVSFNLRLTDSENQPIKWQDGKAISANDIKFSWDFAKNWQIPRYWSSMQFYDPLNTVIVDQDSIIARMTTTSQWLIYTLSDLAYLLPPQVWTQDPRDGLPWANADDILSFDPSAIPYPLAGNIDPGPISLPTQLFGTGPFKLMHSTTFINTNGYGDLSANRNYWITTADLENKVADMFWRAGDVNKDGKIDDTDIERILNAFNSFPGDPNWDPDADITGPANTPPDGQIDVFDLSTAGKYYGETRKVTPRSKLLPRISTYVDIKPGSWPNPINLDKRGLFTVAICGTEDFDTTNIDPTSISVGIEGAAATALPVRWRYEDAATPYTGEPGGGHTLEGDGYLDLVLHFDTEQTVNTLGLNAYVGQTIPLVVSGHIYEELGGAVIKGQDYVWIIGS